MRAVVLVAIVGLVAALGTYIYQHRSPDATAPVVPVLEGEVTAIIENFRHLDTEGGIDKMLLTAAVDKAYANGSHELSQVELHSFGKAGDRKDRILAETCLYNPSLALVVFKTNVKVDTTDGLRVEAGELRYNQETGVVEVEGDVKYARANLDGTCRGAIVETNDERLRMLRDVDMTFHAEDKPLDAGAGDAAAQAGAAPKEGKKKKGGKKGKGGGGGGKRKRARAAALAAGGGGSTGGAKKPAGGGGGAAASPIDFAGGPKIPVRIRSASAVFEKKSMVARYDGGATATRGDDEMRGDTMVFHLTDENRIERVEDRGNAYLRASGRAESTAASMDFFFAEANQLERAVATGGARLVSLGPPPARTVTGEKIEMDMAPGEKGAELRQARANGQSVVTMDAPAATAASPNPSARELKADAVTLDMQAGGQFAQSAQADGNAVLTVTPIKAEPRAERKRVTAPRMRMDFLDAANLAREFAAEGGVRVEFEPLATGDGRLARTTTSQTARADFDAATQDVARLEQAGDFKYVEGERNATAARAVYTKADDTVALRDDRPTVWDAKARTQANEIDLRSGAGASHQARGDVRTTYYSPASTGNAAPFGNTKSPVFVTADKLDARQTDGGVAVYTGAARSWQDDNYVRADTIRLFDDQKRMEADGNVESGLYQMKRKDEKGNVGVVPVFSTASRMRYTDADKMVHYEGGVTSRQAPSEIVSESQDVWLTKGERSEVDRMIAVGSVIATEPGRKATGDRLVYTAADQKAVMTGTNARVEDSAEGTSTGSELTYYVGGDRVRSTSNGANRVRTTRRIKSGGAQQ